MGPYGVHWERTQTWWPMVGAYHDYLARCQAMLRAGTPVADILYLVPEGAPQAFIAEALACTGKRFKSVGHGWDFRLEGKGMVGSALVYNKALIHSAFFRTTEAEKAGHMAGISRRRGFRG